MTNLSVDQQKALALALAQARRRRAQAGNDGGESRDSAMGKVDAVARGAADTLSLGLSDEIAAQARSGPMSIQEKPDDYYEKGIFAGEYNPLGAIAKTLDSPWSSKTKDADYDKALAEERGIDAADEKERGGYRLGGQVAGALMMPMAGSKSLLATAAKSGAAGGAYGFGSGEGGFENRRDNAIKNAVIGTIAGAGAHKVGDILATRAARASIPGEDAIRAAGDAAYKAAEDAGVMFTPLAGERLRTGIVEKLVDMGYDPALQPGAAAVVRRLEDLQGQNFTLKGLDTLRKVASNGFVQGNKSNNKAVTKIINKIDDLVSNPQADDILAGNAEAGSAALSTARDMWSRLAKTDRVTTAVRMAEDRAGSTGAGGNVDNATRQNLRRVLEKPRGFSEKERTLLRTAVKGTPTQNTLRLAGKFAPTGVVSAVLSGGAGYGIGGPLGLALPLAGAGAKAAAEAMTKGNVNKVVEALLSGGKTAQDIARLAESGVGQQTLIEALSRIRSVEGVAGPAMARIAAALSNPTPR